MINNKGLTAVELLICFSLVSIITIAMFRTVNNYKSKQDVESFKNSVTTYKTTLTKEIYTDIINNLGIVSASTEQIGGANIDDPTEAYKSVDFTYKMTLNFKNGVQKIIEVKSTSKCYGYKRNEQGKRELNDNQNCDETNELNIDKNHSEFYVKYNNEKFELPKVDGLKYNSILTEEKNDGFIAIHIGLWHNDYGTEYDALNVIVPNVSKYPDMF